GLTFARMGQPSESSRAKVLAKINAQFPAKTQQLNQELCRLLVYLKAPQIIDRTLALQAAAPTQEEQIHYAYCLRPLSEGWTIEQRKKYFSWFVEASNYR